ncbi:ubiquitin-like protein Pup [Serinibacter salmoneus]|uniref:Prokaryotic ubiquitin-like protein Pup n=1 Tax=Serinibacter salmoneus TaxID=556530 RepID=A0A2A9D1F0_9MICO|nr:ubiquitin-like protein Pup [Serinibacter salmoneus]PFG19772.1 ubiquitin-like protein Pup [Serinibacter salmoneus]
MAQSQEHVTPPGEPDDGEQPVPSHQVSTQAVDDLLDEIDDVLETNAESFVKGFVQKGGQ